MRSALGRDRQDTRQVPFQIDDQPHAVGTRGQHDPTDKPADQIRSLITVLRRVQRLNQALHLGSVQIDEARIKDHLGEMVRGAVEEALNAALDAEADRLCGAGRYARTEGRRDTRAGSYEWSLDTKPDQ